MIKRNKWSDKQINTANAEAGKLVLCKCEEDDSTRLFIRTFNSFATVMTKYGWWNTFTVSEKPCKKGFYVCRIRRFRNDKNGFPNLVVTPVTYVGRYVDEDADAWEYLFESGMFSEMYKTGSDNSVLNIYQVERKFLDASERQLNVKERKAAILKKFLNGEISISMIDTQLNIPFGTWNLARDIARNYDGLRSHYPLLMEKVPGKDDPASMSNQTKIADFLARKKWEYECLGLGNSENLAEMVEAVLKFREDEKAAEKKARKEKRKQLKGE